MLLLARCFRYIADYCKTCEVCQKSQRQRNLRQAEMISMPLIELPFQRITMDVVGPLPRSRLGNKYILTICDHAPRYPEAIALPSTEASQIAKELVSLFSRVGIPEEILTDQGSNFMLLVVIQVCIFLIMTIFKMWYKKRTRDDLLPNEHFFAERYYSAIT